MIKKILIPLLLMVIVLSAFLIPKSLDNGMNKITDKAQKEKAEELVSNIRTVHFNGIQRAMMLRFKVKNLSRDEDNKCYQATVYFYTIFNIRYDKIIANCKSISTDKGL